MFNKPKKRKIPRLPLLLIALAATYFTGFSRGVQLAETEFEDTLKTATEAAYQEGLKNQDWKQHAMNDPVFADKLAHQWWFGLTHKDRKIDLNGKPKKW